jgi:3-oxoadipate enol-lactonase
MTVDTYHRFEGPEDAPVLLLANSLGTPLEMWDDQAPGLAEHFRLLRFDARGHGRSEAPPGPYSIEDLGNDVLDLLDALELERVHFCGLSLGGMTGLWLAVNAAQRIDRLALCATSAHMPPREIWDERAAQVRSEGMEAVADGSIERWFSEESREERPDAVERTRNRLLETSPEGYAACCEAIRDHDMRDEIEAIAAPTLVIVGDEDPSTPPEHGRFIAERVRGARIEQIERARHLLNVEHPKRVRDLLIDHLAEGGGNGP